MIVNFEEALRIVEREAGRVGTLGVERVGLLEAAGRVLAERVVADRDQPGFDRSTRDGYAVRAAEVGGPLRVLGQVRAGEAWRGTVGAGECVQIMTGAPVPVGADAVVMVEHVAVVDGVLTVRAGRSLSAGENIVPRGSEARSGETVVGVGTVMAAAEIALAASCGYPEVAVFARAGVAVIATGDELVEVAEVPGDQGIRNSNSYAIAAMVAAAGGRAERLAIARDTREDIRARVAEGRKSELVVFSGGVSMGEYDLVEEVLEEAGAKFFFTGVKMQPGKPVVFGRLGDGPYFFGLPGNPISTQVTFHCFAEPLLRALGGAGCVGPKWAQGTLGEAVTAKPGVTRLLPARMDGVTVRLVGWQGSGDLAANVRANCYAELLPGVEYGVGEVVRILLR